MGDVICCQRPGEDTEVALPSSPNHRPFRLDSSWLGMLYFFPIPSRRWGMADIPITSVLLVDGSKNQRTYWADQLKRCSPDYQILEADDGQSGMEVYRSRRIDCVVLELSLPDQSGFQTLVNLVPIARRLR